ncbi:MAG: DMT family transporter [Bacteroidetes bacterium]|nr:DMT family transporter [Bacteroidota bacterium]
MKPQIKSAYIKLHIAVFLFGFTAILGKLITLNQNALVWNRLWISCVGLLLVPGLFVGLKKISGTKILTFSAIGVLIALHWLTFYGSIKFGNNVSVTLACLATTPLFTSVFEPLFFKRKILYSEIILGILSIAGVRLIAGVGSFYYDAIISGIISAAIASLFTVLNKKNIGENNAFSVSFIEFFSGWIFVGLIIFLMPGIDNLSLFPQPNNLDKSWNFIFFGIHSDWYYLLVLGLLCTCLAFVFNLQSLKHLSAFTSNLSVNLEPVYGIIMGVIFFKENQNLNTMFYIGTSLILICVLLHPFLKNNKK